jgi:iron complex outermembrane receptor protein
MRHPPGIAYGLLVASLQAHATVAAAQDAGANALEEVVVTAQKRAENLQDIPIAVTAFTATDIERQGFTNVAQMAEFTPNVIFDTTTSISGLSSGAAVFIRGIGQIDFGLTTDPGVGTYVDGVYMSRSVGGVLDTLDIERVEILRAPSRQRKSTCIDDRSPSWRNRHAFSSVSAVLNLSNPANGSGQTRYDIITPAPLARL